MSEPATEAELVVPHDAKCLGCGYSLLHLTKPRCPECGRTFEPAEPLTMACALRTQKLKIQKFGRYLPLWPMLAMIATCWVVAAVVSTFFGTDYEEHWQLYRIVMTLCLSLSAGLAVRRFTRSIVYTGLKEPLEKQDRAVTRLAVRILMPIGLLASICPWSCAFGYGIHLGPIAVTWTGRDGMGGDYVQPGTRVRITETISIYESQ